MKKVYVSLPISGRSLEEAKLHAYSSAVKLREHQFNAVIPFDIAPEENKPYEWYMGKDIENLLKCDCVYFCKGWWKSKGCRLEFAAAVIYNKKLMFE